MAQAGQWSGSSSSWSGRLKAICGTAHYVGLREDKNPKDVRRES